MNVAETVELDKEIAHTHMGFEEQAIVKFDKPKIFAYKANVNEISDYLLRLMNDENLRWIMGERGRAHAARNFEYRMIARRIAGEIKRTLGMSM